MKKIKEFFKRLHTAWKIANGRKCYYMGFSDDNITDERVFLTAAMDAAENYLSIKAEDDEVFTVRLRMVRNALVTEMSVLMQCKNDNGCFVAYDCNSEEDLDELLNQDIR